MTLSAAEILVQDEDVERVEQVVAESLVAWAAGVGDLAGAGEDAPQRHVVLMPPVGGYVAVLEEGGRVDRSLARELAERLHRRVVVAELDGHRLAAALQVFESDGGEREWETPAAEDGAPMPDWADAEGELWRRLGELQVPDVLVAPDWEDLVDKTSPAAQGARISAVAGEALLDKMLIPFGALDDAPAQAPRTRPDLWVADDEGEAQVVESRELPGDWHPQAVRALARVEEAQLSRMLPVLARAADAPRVPSVVFSYEGADDAFAEALEQAREQRPRLLTLLGTRLLSVRGVADVVRERLAVLAPHLLPGRMLGSRLEVQPRDGGTHAFVLDVEELWEAYFARPQALDEMVTDTAARLEAQPPVCDYDEERTLPLLLPADTPGLPALAARPFSGGLWAGLCMDTGDALVPVTRALLARARVGFEDAFEQAVRLLEVETERHDAFVIYEQPEGITVTAEFPDAFTASRLVSEAVRWHVERQLGEGCSIAVPERDHLLAAEPTPEARRWLERETARRFSSSPKALSRTVWVVRNGELEEDGVARDETAAD